MAGRVVPLPRVRRLGKSSRFASAALAASVDVPVPDHSDGGRAAGVLR